MFKIWKGHLAKLCLKDKFRQATMSCDWQREREVGQCCEVGVPENPQPLLGAAGSLSASSCGPWQAGYSKHSF